MANRLLKAAIYAVTQTANRGIAAELGKSNCPLKALRILNEWTDLHQNAVKSRLNEEEFKEYVAALREVTEELLAEQRGDAVPFKTQASTARHPEYD